MSILHNGWSIMNSLGPFSGELQSPSRNWYGRSPQKSTRDAKKFARAFLRIFEFFAANKHHDIRLLGAGNDFVRDFAIPLPPSFSVEVMNRQLAAVVVDRKQLGSYKRQSNDGGAAFSKTQRLA